MTKRTLVQLSILGVGAFLGARAAIPCSLIAPAETAGPFGATSGPRPLLVSEQSLPLLRGEKGLVPIEPATPDPRLADALGAGGAPLSFFVPKEPLPPGQYTFDRDRVDFTVTATAVDDLPEIGPNGRIEIYVDDGDGVFGCGGVSSCGDLSSVGIYFDGITPRGSYLLELSTPEGKSFSRLVSSRFEERLLFYGPFKEIKKLDGVTLCARVTPVSPAGTLGDTLDLGCAKGE